MHSHLRNTASFAPFSAHTTAASYPHSTSPPPEKKQKMSITQTYRLAHRARGKLSSEASRGDHDLRLLVGHANLLDSLMIELQDAEREQDAWFTAATAAATVTPEESRRVQFADSAVTKIEAPDASDDESEDEEIDYSDDEFTATVAPIAIPAQNPRRRARSPPASSHIYSISEEDESAEADSDDEYDNLDLALVRTQSRSGMDVDCPELVHDSDESESDDETGTSPTETIALPQDVHIKDFASQKQIGFLPQQPIVAAY